MSLPRALEAPEATLVSCSSCEESNPALVAIAVASIAACVLIALFVISFRFCATKGRFAPAALPTLIKPASSCSRAAARRRAPKAAVIANMFAANAAYAGTRPPPMVEACLAKAFVELLVSWPTPFSCLLKLFLTLLEDLTLSLSRPTAALALSDFLAITAKVPSSSIRIFSLTSFLATRLSLQLLVLSLQLF